MRTAVIGLGNIGGAIATRLAKSVQVLGVEQDDARRQDWNAQTGHETAGALSDVDWDTVDRALIVVRSSAAAIAITQEIGQLAFTSLACHIMTTLEFDDATQIAHWAQPLKHLRILEQPVSGGAVGAEAGTLTVLTAGPAHENDLEFLRTHLAGHITTFPRYGQPTLVKLLNNGVAAYNLIIHTWALEAATGQGIDATVMQSILQSSSGGSTIADLLPSMGTEQGELLRKDVQLLERALDGKLPVFEVSEEAVPSKLALVHDLTTAASGSPTGGALHEDG